MDYGGCTKFQVFIVFYLLRVSGTYSRKNIRANLGVSPTVCASNVDLMNKSRSRHIYLPQTLSNKALNMDQLDENDLKGGKVGR